MTVPSGTKPRSARRLIHQLDRLPPALAKRMQQEHRRDIQRQRTLQLARSLAIYEDQVRDAERFQPGTRIGRPRLTRPTPMSRADVDRWNEIGGRSLRMLRQQLARDARQQRRDFLAYARAGQTRRQIIGTNTTAIDCDLTATSFSTNAGGTLVASNGNVSLLSPVTSVSAPARNLARFTASTISSSPWGNAGVSIVVNGTFGFTVGVTGMATVTAFGQAFGSFVLNAPRKNEWFPWASPPACGVYLNSVLTGFIFTPPRTAVGLPFTVGADQARLEIFNGAGGGVRTGLLQDAPVSTGWSLPSFSVTAGSIVSVSFSLTMVVWSLFGGSAFVDCLSGSGSGLNIPGVLLRLDY